jgi:putative aminopeptidase FrvX
MPLNLDYLVSKLEELLNIPSPTGFTDVAIAWVEDELKALGIRGRRSKKGALLWSLPGIDQTRQPRAVAAHVDTLGAMVKEIKVNGRVNLSRVGGYDWSTVVGEYCLVHTQAGANLSGTVVTTKQSTHVWGNEVGSQERSASSLEVRLDATVDGRAITSSSDVRALGIEVGDFVSWDARTQVLPSGYIKSRHLDNKAAVAVLLAVTKLVLEEKIVIAADTHCFISNFEEVGHGASAGIPNDIEELLVIDMAAMGEGQTSSEHHCTLCLKDSSGPYDHQFSNGLRALAAVAGIDLKLDIYPYYGSDGSAALRAGLEARVALIGPGVDASHAYERTHSDALEATANLVLEYLKS